MKYILTESQFNFIRTIVEGTKKDLSPHIKRILQTMVNEKDVCDVDVYRTDDGLYKGVIYFIGGPDSERWPTTQDIFVLRQNIKSQMINKIFDYIGVVVEMESKLVAKC